MCGEKDVFLFFSVLLDVLVKNLQCFYGFQHIRFRIVALLSNMSENFRYEE